MMTSWAWLHLVPHTLGALGRPRCLKLPAQDRNVPWKSNVGPSDEELDRVVQAYEEQRRCEVARLVADAEIYDRRLTARGSRVYQFWGRGCYKGRLLTNITKTHTASAAVNEGSIKALRTALPDGDKDRLDSLPEQPSLAWLKRIDANTAIDQGRKVTLQRRREIQTEQLVKVEEMDYQRRTGRTPRRKTGEK